VHAAPRPAGVPDAPLSTGPRLSALAVYLTRSIETMKKGGILPSFAGIAVTDRYAGYWSETWTAIAGHQACAAHLVRDLPAVPDDVRSPLELEFRRAVTVGLAAVRRVPGPRTAVRQQPGRELLEFCSDREGDVLCFARDTSIWPTNNLSERGVRPLKTQQKVSGRLTSDDVTQDRLDIRSYIDTARKHGLGALQALEQLMLGIAWTPLAQPASP
jgi:transposase